MTDYQAKVEAINSEFSSWCLCDDDACEKSRNFDKATNQILALLDQRAVEELEQLDTLTHSFMSLGKDFVYEYRQSAVDERIKELKSQQRSTHDS